jgi:hypothetical protein
VPIVALSGRMAADAIEADLLPANGRRPAAEPEPTEQAWSASS